MSGTNERREWMSPAMLWACAALTVLSLLLWALSSVRGYEVKHGTVSDVRSVADDATAFEMHFRTRRVELNDGRLIVSSTLDISNALDRAMLEMQWAPEVGWKWRNLGGQMYGLPWFSWTRHQKIILGAGHTKAWASGEDSTTNFVFIPFWLTALPGAVPLLVYFSPGRRRARRRAQGLCAFCGYARAGLSSTQACPECGHE